MTNMKRISVLLLALVVLTTALFAQGVKDERRER